MSFCALFFIFFACFFTNIESGSPVTNSSPVTCSGINEVYSKCAVTCNTCEWAKRLGEVECDLKKCKPGCECKPGFHRQNGVCISTKQCFNCEAKKNQRYYYLAQYCPERCDDRNPLALCDIAPLDPNRDPRLPNGGCACKEGYILNRNRECILETACTGADICTKDNQYWAKCPNPCDVETCGLLLSPKFCDREQDFECKPQCVCRKPYVLDGDFCVLKDECQCPFPQELVNCPSPCPGGTCASPDFEECGVECKEKGCQCKQGEVLAEVDFFTTCVPVADCNKYTCSDPNETFATREEYVRYCESENEYKTGCLCKRGFVYKSKEDRTCIPSKTCDKFNCKDPNEEPVFQGETLASFCNEEFDLADACICKDKYTYVSKQNMTCIPRTKCPQFACKDPNEVYYQEELAGYCDAPDTPKKGCVCKDGYVYKSKNSTTCIRRDQCPKKCPGENEEYANSDFEPTCVIRTRPKCPKPKKLACYCKSGFVRDNGKCIKPEKCRNTYPK